MDCLGKLSYFEMLDSNEQTSTCKMDLNPYGRASTGLQLACLLRIFLLNLVKNHSFFELGDVSNLPTPLLIVGFSSSHLMIHNHVEMTTDFE